MIIPEKVMYDFELNSNEKLILTMIYSFNILELLTFKYIGKKLGLTPQTVKKAVDHLSKIGYLSVYKDELSKVDDIDLLFKQG